MSGANDHDNADRLGDEAIDWFVRLHSGEATDDDRAAFANWRGRSAAHEVAAREAEETWEEIGHTSAARSFAPDSPRLGFHLSRRGVLVGATAASVGGLAILLGAAGPPSALLADYHTRRGERRREVLPDGSTVWLNTETAFSVDFSAAERRLTLHTGEALFEVAKYTDRPFIVTAGGGEAQALGTVYAVRASRAGWQVDVAEGIVGVRAVRGGEVRKLTAGEGARYGDGRFLIGTEQVNAAAIGAWRRGKLIFNRRPLGDVVAELQRHRYGRIVITDHKLTMMPVTGVFDLEDDETTFDMLRQSLPLEIRRFPLLTILRPA